MPQNISITIDEGQETPILLNCSAYATIFNDIEYRVLETPISSYGRLYFENKTDFPSGSNIDVGDTLGRLRFRSTSHGRVNFQYYCPERNLTFTPLLGSVVINIRPVVRCQNTVITTGAFSLDDRSTKISNLTFTFISVPTWGNLGSVMGGEIYEQGSSTAETNIRLYGRLNINQSHVGSFAYVATNKYRMTSDRCEVGFVISCRPLFMNVFNYSSSEFCTTCPMGATCSINGEHLPFAAKGFWTRTGEYSPNAIYLPCLPVSACPGLPSGECSAGFRGFRCATCAPKYYKFGDDCLPCQTGHEVNTILAFVVLIGGGALAYGLSKLVKAGPTFGLVSILISFLQTIVILRGFQLNWPPEFYEVLGWLSAINFNIEFTAPECFVGDFISYSQKLQVTLFLPIFFIAIAFLVSELTVAVQWIRYKLLRAKKKISTHDHKKGEIFKSINAILVFLYTSVATSALGHFDCLLDIDGNYYLDRDASLKCYDDAWNADLPFVVSAICIYVVGIPIYFSLMFNFMYQKRRNSRIWSNARIIAFRIMKFDEFYHPGRQYFVLINLLQKLALVAAGVYFTDQRGIQTVLTSLCLNATLVLSIVYKPYSLGILNTAEQLSFAASIAVLGFGLPFLTDSIGSSVKSFLTFTILSVIFGFILFIVVACLIEAKARASSSRIASLFRKKADAPETPYKQSLLVEESRLRV
ncbi:hypothetical protein BKA69DRAFT_764800 [Paraphysoderma sedebokerense]|nr:hypothetical protein BKA69DRAFT_764800 [Paraphysoderma sedebokerense]